MKPIESWNGDSFRALRERTGTSVADLARRLNVTEESIGRWERGLEVPAGHARELLDVWLAENPPGRASGLAGRGCVPVPAGTPHLDEDEIARHLRELDPGWSVEDGRRLRRDDRFPDFAEALAFVNRVGAIAEEENHHPDVRLRWGRVNLVIFTHTVNGLTENDFILAAKIDAARGD